MYIVRKKYQNYVHTVYSHTLITLVPSRFVMEKVDLVMVGAEGVAESGGIINKVGGAKQT